MIPLFFVNRHIRTISSRQLYNVLANAGENHTFVLTKDNRLWVSGSNRYGQLGGLIDKQYCNPFIAVSWPINRGKVQQVIAGAHHTLVLTDDNQL